MRTEKRVGNTATAYAYESGRLVSVTTGGETASFTYDEFGSPLTIASGGKTYAYRMDERGSVIELTDTTNHLPAVTYRYDAWGAIVEEVGDASLRAANPYTFGGAHGVMFDPETQLHLMGARYYSAVLGRFVSRDPAEDDPTQSTYAYADNNPVINIDPSGESVEQVKRWIKKAKRMAQDGRRNFKHAPCGFGADDAGDFEEVSTECIVTWRPYVNFPYCGYLGCRIFWRPVELPTTHWNKAIRKSNRKYVNKNWHKATFNSPWDNAIHHVKKAIRDSGKLFNDTEPKKAIVDYTKDAVDFMRKYKANPSRFTVRKNYSLKDGSRGTKIKADAYVHTRKKQYPVRPTLILKGRRFITFKYNKISDNPWS